MKRHPFLIVPLLVYLWTCAPTIGLGDTAILIDAILRANLSTHVNNHPMTVAFGWLFSHLPFRDIAYSTNLVSVFFGSLAVGFFYWALYRLFSSRLVAALTASMLMLSYSLWWHSTVVENYATTAFLVALYLCALVEWKKRDDLRFFYAMFFVTGLGIFNHVQMGFVGVGCLAALAVYLWQERRTRAPTELARIFAICGVVGVTGLVPWLVFLTKDSLALHSLKAGLSEAFFGKFQGIMLHGSYADGLQATAVLLFQQAPSPLVLVLLAGPFLLVRAWRLGPQALAVLVPCLVNAFFFLSYDTWDRYAFLLLSFMFLFFAAGFAVDAAVRWLKERDVSWRVGAVLAYAASLAWGPVFYGRLAEWGNDPESFWHARYSNLYTYNTYRVNEYIVNPNKRAYWDVDSYVRLLFEKLPKGATYVDDDARAYYPVEFYQRHYGLRKDLTLHIMNSWGFDGWGITPKTLHRKFDRMIEEGGEIFLVSKDHPFRRQLESYKRYKELVVEPFALDEMRWIYRVRPVNGGTELPKELKLALDGPALDLSRSLVATHAGLSDLVDQDMHDFGSAWSHGFQLFGRAEGKAGQFDIDVTSESDVQGSLAIGLTRAPDFGELRILVNGAEITPRIDLGSDRVKLDSVRFPAHLKAGKNRLRFEIFAADGDAARNAFGLDTLRLISGTAQLGH